MLQSGAIAHYSAPKLLHTNQCPRDAGITAVALLRSRAWVDAVQSSEFFNQHAFKFKCEFL